MKLINQNNKLPKRKKRNNKSLLQDKPYSLKQSIQKLGPGYLVVRVTQRYTYTGVDEDAVVNFMYDVVDNAEFEDKLPKFRYFKILGVKLIMNANNKVGATASGRITIDWNSNTLENIYKDDGSKEFPNYLTKNLIFRYLVPNANLSMSDGRTINFGIWTPTNFPLSNATPPGFIKISAAFGFTFTAETLVAFKGSQTTFTPNKIIGGLNKEKAVGEIKEEEKEEEKEEGENKEDERKEVENEAQDNKDIILKIKEQLNKIDL
jgi:hypothetical protein